MNPMMPNVNFDNSNGSSLTSQQPQKQQLSVLFNNGSSSGSGSSGGSSSSSSGNMNDPNNRNVSGKAGEFVNQASMNIDYDPITGIAVDLFDKMSDIASTPKTIIILIIIIGLYFVLFTSLGTNGENKGATILESFLWALLIVIVLINGFQYFFNVNITTEIKNLFSAKPQIDLTAAYPGDPSGIVGAGVDGAPGMKGRKQAFHIPANIYDYDNAKALCEAYGARLATYDEVEEAYKSGGEWCSYGWSDNQMILYPTQKETWEKLQKNQKTKNACGRPGVNGGYLDNTAEKFGVNCFGVKPDMNPASSKFMSGASSVDEDLLKDPEHQKRVDEMRKKINQVVVAPFSKSAWSLV